MNTPTTSFTDVPETQTAVSLQPSPWLIALHAFAKGVTAGSIVVSALMGLEASLGVPRVISAAVMGFLGFAILFAGEGLAILLWKVLGLVCRLTHFAWGTRALQSVPPCRLAGFSARLSTLPETYSGRTAFFNPSSCRWPGNWRLS